MTGKIGRGRPASDGRRRLRETSLARGGWWAEALIAGLLAAVALSGCGGGEQAGQVGEGEPAEIATREATLYFPGPRGLLYPETRELPLTESTEERIQALVAALLEGPASAAAEGAGLVAPLPAGVTLATVYRSVDGSAFLDFEAPEGAPPPPVGSAGELQIVYSVVNTVVLNSPSVERVAILWNGNQPATLAGHVAIGHPLAANRGLIAEDAEPTVPPASDAP